MQPNSCNQEEEEAVVPDPIEKRSRCDDPTLALLIAMIPATPGIDEANSNLSPHEQTESKIKFFKNIDQSLCPMLEKTLEWWSSRYVK
jgi:hypothetical protein